MNIDDFMQHVFVEERYTCMEFACDVWAAATGEDLKNRLGSVMRREFGMGETLRAFKSFRRLREPVSPCLVYMTRLNSEPHMGVYLDDSVLHLTTRGPEYLPLALASRGFTHIRFYQ